MSHRNDAIYNMCIVWQFRGNMHSYRLQIAAKTRFLYLMGVYHSSVAIMLHFVSSVQHSNEIASLKYADTR